MDEGTGTASDDSSGNQYTGTLTNGVGRSGGKYGGGTSFDGVNDYIDYGNSAGLQSNQSFTVMGWVRPRIGDKTLYYTLISKWNSSVNETGFQLLIGNGALPYAQFGVGISGGYNGTTATTLLENDKWYHLAGVYNLSNDTVSIYVNGNLENTYVLAYDMGTNTTSNVRIGATTDVGANWMSGDIDDVRWYNYVRSPAQIAYDYNRGKPLVHLKFDECQGATAYNSAFNANGTAAGMDGTISYGSTGNTAFGSCSSGVSTEMWNDGTTGKFSGSLGFDGVDDYVEVADTSTLRMDNGSWSISLWANPANVDQTSPLITKRLNSGNFEQWSMWICGDYSCSTNGQFLTAIFIEQAGTSDRRAVSDIDVADGNWHHYVAVADSGANAVYLYVDGKRVSVTSLSTGSWPTINNTDPVRVANSNGSAYYQGNIDDVRIYNYPLSQSQVLLLTNEGSVQRFGPSTGSP
jgi:hypothetical protein